MGNPQEASAPPPASFAPDSTQQSQPAPPSYQASTNVYPQLNTSSQQIQQPVQQQTTYTTQYNTQPVGQTGGFVTTQQPVVVPTVVHHGQVPVNQICQFCQQNIMTNVRHEMGGGSWLICLGLCFFSPCCCCLPCCINGLQDVVHHCPSCKRVVGRKNLMG